MRKKVIVNGQKLMQLLVTEQDYYIYNLNTLKINKKDISVVKN